MKQSQYLISVDADSVERKMALTMPAIFFLPIFSRACTVHHPKKHWDMHSANLYNVANLCSNVLSRLSFLMISMSCCNVPDFAGIDPVLVQLVLLLRKLALIIMKRLNSNTYNVSL